MVSQAFHWKMCMAALMTPRYSKANRWFSVVHLCSALRSRHISFRGASCRFTTTTTGKEREPNICLSSSFSSDLTA